jgi:hypothetical protein
VTKGACIPFNQNSLTFAFCASGTPFAISYARESFKSLCKAPETWRFQMAQAKLVKPVMNGSTEQERINMNKIFASAFLALGAALSLTGYFNYLGTLSAGSDAPSLFVTPTDATVWLIIFGLISAITGAYGFAKDEHSDSSHAN